MNLTYTKYIILHIHLFNTRNITNQYTKLRYNKEKVEMKQLIDVKAPTQTEYICSSFVFCYYKIRERGTDSNPRFVYLFYIKTIELISKGFNKL